MATIRKERSNDIPAREACSTRLRCRALAKTAERLREGRLPPRAVVRGGRKRPRRRHCAALARLAGPARPALLLGPLAVDDGGAAAASALR